MKWEELSFKEKAEAIKVGVKNGLHNIEDIKGAYNKFQNGGKKGPTYNPETQVWTNHNGQTLEPFKAYTGDYGTTYYLPSGAVKFEPKKGEPQWRYAENAERKYIGGSKNKVRQEYFNRDEELVDSIYTISDRYDLNPNLVASRIAREAPIDDNINHYNNTNGYFGRSSTWGPLWGLDDVGTLISNGDLNIKEPWVKESVKTNVRFKNEKGRTTYSVSSPNFFDGVSLTAATLKYYRDKIKEKNSEITDERADQLANAAFNMGIQGAHKNQSKIVNTYKPFIKLPSKKSSGGNLYKGDNPNGQYMKRPYPLLAEILSGKSLKELENDYTNYTITKKILENQQQLTQGRDKNWFSENVIDPINNYVGEFHNSDWGDIALKGKYILPAIGGAPFAAKTAAGLATKQGLTNTFMGILGAAGVDTASYLSTGNTWGENINSLTGLNTETADFTNPGAGFFPAARGNKNNLLPKLYSNTPQKHRHVLNIINDALHPERYPQMVKARVNGEYPITKKETLNYYKKAVQKMNEGVETQRPIFELSPVFQRLRTRYPDFANTAFNRVANPKLMLGNRYTLKWGDNSAGLTNIGNLRHSIFNPNQRVKDVFPVYGKVKEYLKLTTPNSNIPYLTLKDKGIYSIKGVAAHEVNHGIQRFGYLTGNYNETVPNFSTGYYGLNPNLYAPRLANLNKVTYKKPFSFTLQNRNYWVQSPDEVWSELANYRAINNIPYKPYYNINDDSVVDGFVNKFHNKFQLTKDEFRPIVRWGVDHHRANGGNLFQSGGGG